MKEAITAFVQESGDNLERVKAAYLASSTAPDLTLLDQLYCTVHMIKGTCGFLGFARLEELAEAGEVLLHRLKSGQQSYRPALKQPVLQLLEMLQRMLGNIEHTGVEGDAATEPLVAGLRSLVQDTDTPGSSVTPAGFPVFTATRRQALVIDDSKAMRKVLSRVLDNLGYQVSEAASAEEGLDLIRTGQRTPEVILVDWNLPEMDGLEFARQVRANPELKKIRLMMVTSETDKGQKQRAFDIGIDEYVMKPFTREALTQRISELSARNIAEA